MWEVGLIELDEAEEILESLNQTQQKSEPRKLDARKPRGSSVKKLTCKLKRVGFTIPEQHYLTLKSLADEKGLTVNEYVRGHFYNANDKAESICDATFKPDGKGLGYVERRKVDALTKKIKQAELKAKKANEKKERAERKVKGAQIQIDQAESAVDSAKTKTAKTKAESARKKASAALRAATKEHDVAKIEVNETRAEVIELAQERNDILAEAGKPTMPIPSMDCEACKHQCGPQCDCEDCKKKHDTGKAMFDMMQDDEPIEDNSKPSEPAPKPESTPEKPKSGGRPKGGGRPKASKTEKGGDDFESKVNDASDKLIKGIEKGLDAAFAKFG